MSFYRTVLAIVAAAAIVTPAFADDTATTQGTSDQTQGQTYGQPADATNAQQIATTDSSTKIDLNTASTKELMTVKGIDASKARAIVAYRKKHGNFTNTNDLFKVRGFSKLKTDTINQIINQVSVN